ncbi:MFS transporter [Pseudomonas fluorescens]|uniref:Inner membrane transport protein YdhC n=1 Tax=Pseudomonas fluorescens TaxID=294 RepID=A0A5E7BUZ5_PSEFL|nr:MFS transporter [Pseudomonas fluorescens]VVN96302.1 Inner membrane transport protein YdhC [Pseudomonas fluorescens]
MTHPRHPPKKTSVILLLMTMTLLGVFPLDVVLPSFPALSDYFRTSSSDIALSVSVFAIGLALSVVLIGPLSDLLGRKKLLLGGIAVAVVGATGCLFSSEYRWFLGFRVIQAVGCGSFVLSQALVQDLFAGREQERIRIWMVTGGGIFISISPLLGTWLQLHLGWQGSFYIFIAIAAAVFLKACFFLENAPAKTAGPRHNIIQSYRTVCCDFRFLAYWLICAIVFACHFSFIVISPLIFMEQLQLSAYEFSLTLLLYGAAYIIGGIIAGLLSTRINANTQIIAGLCLIFFSGLVMLCLLNQFGVSTLTVLIPMIICTAGTTITRPAATSKAMNLFPDNAGTSASAGNTLIFIFGGLISALINLTANNLESTLAACFLILSVAGLVLNALTRRGNCALIAD